MILPYPKQWSCIDCKEDFEKPPSFFNPINGMDMWKPKCPKCKGKNVFPKYAVGVRNAIKNMLK